MSDEKENVVVKAAAHLLANRPRHRTEGNVQSDVEALLRAMRVGTIESHYQLGNDQADIYLPNRRTFIECKPYPKAADPERPQSRKTPESPREQLDRYVHAEIENELQLLPGLSTGVPDGPWLGIVTDGSHWHVYRYPHEADADGSLESSKDFLNEGEALATFLSETLGTEMVGKEWIPERPGELFSDLKDDLDDLYKYLPKRATAPTLTKRKLWLNMMETSGMVPADEPGQERLFLAHSFLIVVARLVSHTLSGPRAGGEWSLALREGFASWVLDFSRGQRWASRVWDLVDGYDWRRRRGDVLRDLYHRYVSEQDRKVFGEFYTPDWLAALMVEEVLDEEWIEKATTAALAGDASGVGVLDPACGSGTFLYHAALRILGSPSVKGLRPVEQANVVTHLVNGMDIHPVAVEMARVNIERALPGEPTDGGSAFRVFLGDSLQAATRGELLFGHTKDAMRLTTPSGNQALIPIGLVQSPSFAENMRRMVNAAAEGAPLPPGIKCRASREALESCHEDLTKIIKDEGNSVWTWYAVNLAGPYLLAERKIDRIVANPPWVRLKDIQVERRKREMEHFVKSLRLHSGEVQAPQLDIASFFVLRTRTLYASDPDSDPGAWLVKKSAIGSGNWRGFREQHAGTLAQTVDLQRLNPFNGGDATRCCLLMEHRPLLENQGPRVEATLGVRRRPGIHDSLAMAQSKFEFREALPPLPQGPSGYEPGRIRSGATIFPHVLALVESRKKGSRPGWTRVKTRKATHRPWKQIPSQHGEVPTNWIRPLHTSHDLLPYTTKDDLRQAIIPLDGSAMLHTDPGRDCPFWRELEEVYESRRGKGGGTPPTLLARFDHMGQLSAQQLTVQRGRRVVLHPKSGDIMRAARTRAGEAIADITLFWLAVSSEAEAGYLVALLNAQCLTRAFAESRESGRDFASLPWRKVPIPRYDKRDQRHRRLAELCSIAERTAASRVSAELAKRPNLGQVGLSKAVRESVSVSNAGREIESLAARLLPKQAS